MTLAEPAPPRRITVIAPNARIDVAVPGQNTVAELVPQLVRMTGSNVAVLPTATGWCLSRLGGSPLESTATLAALDVRDGEVLHLSPRDRRIAPLLLEDVVDAIAHAASDRDGTWRPEITRRAGLGFAAAGWSALAALVATWPSEAAPVVGAALALTLLLAGGVLARSTGDALAGVVLATAGAPAAWLAGGAIAAATPGQRSTGFAIASLVSYAALGVAVLARDLAWLVGTGSAAAVAAVAAGATLVGVPASSVAAVVMVLVIVFSPALPLVALRSGRVPLPRVPSDAAAFRRDDRLTAGPEVAQQTRSAVGVLTGLLAATALLAMGASLVLARAGTSWGLGMAALGGVVLMLRARAYIGTYQRVVLLLGGGGALAVTVTRLAFATDGRARAAAVAATALGGVVALGYAVRARRGTPSPYWARLLDIVEGAALLGLVPVAAAVLDMYAAIRQYGR